MPGGVLATLTNDKAKTRGTVAVAEYNKAVAEYQCEVGYRGSTSMYCEKKSFSVKLLDAQGADLDAALLDIRSAKGGDNSWILDAANYEASRLRNRLSMDLWNDMQQLPYNTDFGGRSGTEGRFVEVYLDGEYRGLYCLSDKVDRKLLGLKKEKDGAVRGALYKGQAWATSTALADDANTLQAWELQYPKEVTEAAYAPLRELIAFTQPCYNPGGLNEAEQTAFKADFESHYIVDNLVDYAAFLCLTLGCDQVGKNWILSVQDAGSPFMVSPWDCDASFGRRWGGLPRADGQETYGVTFWLMSRAPYSALWNGDLFNFRQKLSDRLAELTAEGGLFSPAKLRERIAAYRVRLVDSGAWGREVAKWQGKKAADEKILTLSDDLQSDEDQMVALVEHNNANLKNLAQSLGEHVKPNYHRLRWTPFADGVEPHQVAAQRSAETLGTVEYDGPGTLTCSSTNTAVATAALTADNEVVVIYTGRPGNVEVVLDVEKGEGEGYCDTAKRAAIAVGQSALKVVDGLGSDTPSGAPGGSARYDLSGRRLSGTPHGLYVQDGKLGYKE